MVFVLLSMNMAQSINQDVLGTQMQAGEEKMNRLTGLPLPRWYLAAQEQTLFAYGLILSMLELRQTVVESNVVSTAKVHGRALQCF
jgi:hypothetical protein